jgi:hypothetical protein
VARKYPYSSGSTDHGVTTESGWSGFACGVPTMGNRAGSQLCGAVVSNPLISTIGMNCR